MSHLCAGCMCVCEGGGRGEGYCSILLYLGGLKEHGELPVPCFERPQLKYSGNPLECGLLRKSTPLQPTPRIANPESLKLGDFLQ